MHEILTQLVLKWARYGPESPIHVTDDFTRLTLDSIAICAMDTRFNSFYKEAMNPFPQAMTEVLAEAARRAGRPSIANRLMRSSERQYHENIQLMQSVAQEIVTKRRQAPTDKKDLVNAMLHGKDPKTGEKMSDASIVDNMITFLIAGKPRRNELISLILIYSQDFKTDNDSLILRSRDDFRPPSISLLSPHQKPRIFPESAARS